MTRKKYSMLIETPRVLKLMKQIDALKKKLDRELYLERLRGGRSPLRGNPKRKHK